MSVHTRQRDWNYETMWELLDGAFFTLVYRDELGSPVKARLRLPESLEPEEEEAGLGVYLKGRDLVP